MVLEAASFVSVFLPLDRSSPHPTSIGMRALSLNAENIGLRFQVNNRLKTVRHMDHDE